MEEIGLRSRVVAVGMDTGTVQCQAAKEGEIMSASWLAVLGWFIFVLAFMRIWSWIDGTDKWERKNGGR